LGKGVHLGGAALSLESVNKEYRTGPDQKIVALKDVTLEVAPGTVVGIVGPSGSGKSTLLHVIGAMDRADSGRIEVGDFEVSSLSRRDQVSYRRTIGFVFQRFHLLPALTVLDNVVAPLLPYRTDFDKFARGQDLLIAVGLDERSRSLPSRLSGGQQQRVAIARALINDPGLLLADEPTGNLDSRTGNEIMALLLSMREQRGMTVLVATHDPVIATRCDRMVRIEDGELIDDIAISPRGDAEEVLRRIGRLDPSS
jgi:putative ABC transport system ATP-binding protein